MGRAPVCIYHLRREKIWHTSISMIHDKMADFESPLQTLAIDLLNPSAENQLRSHKLKRLVQNPNSFFMDVKCPGCFAITTVFSHAQTVVVCSSCAQVLCQPTGGKGRLTEGECLLGGPESSFEAGLLLTSRVPSSLFFALSLF
jgi:small subunit ribosomal protein S27e